jgi:hypothetical protein
MDSTAPGKTIVTVTGKKVMGIQGLDAANQISHGLNPYQQR